MVLLRDAVKVKDILPHLPCLVETDVVSILYEKFRLVPIMSC